MSKRVKIKQEPGNDNEDVIPSLGMIDMRGHGDQRKGEGYLREVGSPKIHSENECEKRSNTSTSYDNIVPDVICSTIATATAAAPAVETMEDSNDNQDESDGDDENFYKPPEPDYLQANKLPFRSLCQRFEQVWSLKKKRNMSHRNQATKDDIMQSLLPKSIISYLKGGSPFPFLRLMVPDLDTIRPYLGMKENSLGKIWAEAIGLGPNSGDYMKLIKFTDPIIAGPIACGDLSMAVYEVMCKRFPEYIHQQQPKQQGQTPINAKAKKNHKGITIGKINELLDQLAMIKAQTNNFGSKQKMRIKWVEKLISLKVSPLEHKWIIRIILSNLELGVGSDRIINYYHPWAQDLYAANKNIKTLCATLCDEEFIMRRKEQIELEKNAVDNHNRMNHLPKSNEPAALNSTIAPMLSMRTSFDTFLVDIQKRHKAYTDLLEKDDPLRSSLSLKHPVFSCEIKMDGERILSHVKRGIVKIQTRNSVWYSKLYSPVLGPSLRRAIEKYDVDVILDGEVISWDDVKKKTISFGYNRGVAKTRRDFMRRNGLLDLRDTNLHNDEKEEEGMKIMTDALTAGFDKGREIEFDEGIEPGKGVWLKYVVFDILYLGGPEATKVISDAFDPFQCSSLIPPNTGSILNLDLWKRRRILEILITPQPNMVEIVETTIIRPDGSSVDGSTYFATTDRKEDGHSPMVLDSINCTLDGIIPNFEIIDSSRLQQKSLKDMDKARMLALDKAFADIVTTRQLEGLVFKDLSTPYGLGERFRNKGYWFKLKDDYNKSGHASDLDLVVLGGQFATGMRNQGYLNTFLCGCIDSDRSNGVKFMTVVYVNGQSTSDANLKKLLTNTGFFTNVNSNRPRDFGKWFKLSNGAIPDFISQRTFQHSDKAVNSGWKFKKEHYPDMWIHPQDSFVLTINAGELNGSKDFSAGVCLRFPRINRIRAKEFDGGPKPIEDIENVLDLHNLYHQRRLHQQDAERESQSGNNFNYESIENKFKSMGQNLRKRPIGKKRRLDDLNVRLPKIKHKHEIKSNALSLYSFMVLDGCFKLGHDNSLDKLQAASEGWHDVASSVKCQQDVIDYILKHGGRIGNSDCDFVVGGSLDDARVVNYQRAIQRVTEATFSCRTNTDKNLMIMAKSGVVKWTFLFASVHNNSTRGNKSDTGTLNEAITLKPRKHDFLVLSKFQENELINVEDSYGIHLTEDTNMSELIRALDTASRLIPFKTGKEWQYVIDESFTRDEKLQLIGSRHFFCDMNKLALTMKSLNGHCGISMVLYPDIFNPGTNHDLSVGDSSFSFSHIYDEKQGFVVSVLPLAKAMGAKVVTSLQYNVTHVLCEIACESLHWHPGISMNIFHNNERGIRLHHKLKELNTDDIPVDIMLISPSWIRNMWQ